MGLVHEFIISNDVRSDYDYDKLSKSKLKVEFSDDIFLALFDYFEWIKVKKTENQSDYGLNYYGISEIKGSELHKLENLLNELFRLYSLAPDDFYIKTGLDLEKNDFIETHFLKSDFLSAIKSLLDLVHLANDKNVALIHFGI